MSDKKDTRMTQLFQEIHDLDLLKWVSSEGYDCPARLRRRFVSLASAELSRREHKRESELREQQARQHAVAVEILSEKEASVDDEAVERVARWAHAEARSRTTVVPVWEELLSHERDGWIKQARAAIEGEK